MLAWLLAAAVFNAVYRPARRGRKVAYLTIASFVFLVIALACSCWSTPSTAAAPQGALEQAASGTAYMPARRADHEAANDRLQPPQSSLAVRERLAFSPTQVGQALDAHRDAAFRPPRPCCCRPATAWRSTPPPKKPGTGPATSRSLEFMADFHRLPMYRDLRRPVRADRRGRRAAPVHRGRQPRQHGGRRAADSVAGETGLRTGQGAAKRRAADARHLSNGGARGQARGHRNARCNQRRVSIPSVAVGDFAREIFERFDDKQVLVIGAGEMAEETLRYLQDEGAHDVTVVNRSLERAEQLAERWQGRAAPGNDLPQVAGRGRPGDQHHRGRRADRHAGDVQADRSRSLPAAAVRARPGHAARFRSGDRRSAGRVPVLDRRPASRLRQEPPRARQGAARGDPHRRSRKPAASWPSCTIGPRRRSSSGCEKAGSSPRTTSCGGCSTSCPSWTSGRARRSSQSFDRLINKLLHPPLESLRSEAEKGPPHGLLDALKRLFQIEGLSRERRCPVRRFFVPCRLPSLYSTAIPGPRFALPGVPVMSQTVFATCTLCEAMCGLKYEVDGERILSVAGDADDVFSQGYICPKGGLDRRGARRPGPAAHPGAAHGRRAISSRSRGKTRSSWSLRGCTRFAQRHGARRHCRVHGQSRWSTTTACWHCATD